MTISAGRMALVVILIIGGLYLLLDRTSSPINHEAIGLGDQHDAHLVVGIVLILVAVYVYRSGRKKPTQVAVPPSTPP
ncbi:MAG: hypothetical protein HY619_07155 [Thaumarchaeota archaeon]|nr:hypothetical protein [Nitrososphaerota archaeon]